MALLLIAVYSFLALLSIPTTCSPVNSCSSDTPVGKVIIRPIIDYPNFQHCQVENQPLYPHGLHISEAIFNILESQNFNNATNVFGNTYDKWQVEITLVTTCNEICKDDDKPIRYTKTFSIINADYTIDRITSSFVPGFAFVLVNVPVNGNIDFKVVMSSPCFKHLSSCGGSCSNPNNKFSINYEGRVSRSAVRDNQEIRITLQGQNSPTNEGCSECQ